MSLKEQQTEFAKKLGITYEQLHKLMATYKTEDLMTCLELLKSVKFRSTFRASCAAQLRGWLANPGIKLKPLTKPQLDALKPTWPINIQIPRTEDQHELV